MEERLVARTLTLGTGLAIACLVASSAEATPRLESPHEFGGAVCEVLPTPDGFAALRAGPSAGAPLIRRMKTGDGVVLRFEAPYPLAIRNGWIEVVHWPDGRFHETSDRAYATGRIGWVARRLIGECG
jgi:hypothetical protein